MNSIAAKFTGELTSSSERTQLSSALSAAISRIYEDLSQELISTVASFKTRLNTTAKEVENGLLENISSEFDTLLSQCKNKEQEIGTYRDYIVLLDKELARL